MHWLANGDRPGPQQIQSVTGTQLRAPCSIRGRELFQLLSISLSSFRQVSPQLVQEDPVGRQRTADDGSREKNEPIGLNRAYLVGDRDAHA